EPVAIGREPVAVVVLVQVLQEREERRREVRHGAHRTAGFRAALRAGSRSSQRSPTFLSRPGIEAIVTLCGAISPRSTSSHVHGAETGAPGLGRRVYGA